MIDKNPRPKQPLAERLFWINLGVLLACVVCKPLIPIIAHLTGQEYSCNK
jgi:hypothetical protein